jgi:hypothetical protein
MLIPIYFISIIYRMKHIYITDSGFYIKDEILPWKDIEKIKLFLGNSGRFTIVYNKNGKRHKIFGAHFIFSRESIIFKLKNIAETHNIPISKYWI